MVKRTMKKLWIHYGIPRTGSSSLRGVIRKYCQAKGVKFDESAYLDQKIPDDLDFVLQHEPFPLYRRTSRESGHFTFLRHPLAAAVSEYFWARAINNLPEGCQMADYINDLPDCYNPYCRWLTALSGKDEARIEEKATPVFWKERKFFEGGSAESLLAEAMSTLGKRFAFVGITEKFEESLFMLRTVVGWDSLPPWQRVNPSTKPGGFDDARIIDEIKYKILRSVAADIALYDHVNGIFERDVEQIYRLFPGELPAYKQACRQLDQETLKRLKRAK